MAFLVGRLPVLDYVNYLVQDRLIASASPPDGAGNVVIVGIDDESLQAFPEPLVMWHKYLAGVIDGARIGGARVIGMDMIPGISLDWLDRKLDLALFKALRKAGSAGTPAILGFDSGVYGKLPLRKFSMAASGMGHLNFWPDRDGVVRAYRLAKIGETDQLPPLAGAMLQHIGKSYESDTPIHVDYRYPPLPIVSFAEVYKRQQQQDVEWLQEHLGGKILLVGITARGLHDHHSAPPSPATGGDSWIYGVMIHGLAVETLLSGHGLSFVAEWIGIASVVVVGLLAGLLFLWLPPSRAGGLTILLGMTVAGFIYLAFRGNYLVPAGPLIVAVFMPALITGLYRYVVEYWQFRKLQRYFKSYVSSDVMKDIMDHHGDVEMGGSSVTATVMFTDIRNFTTLSERMPPCDVVAGLNRYFEAMTHAVIESGGYVNRYLGDGVLAIFGAPNPLPNDGAPAAVEAAFRMREMLAELNHSQLFPGVDEIRIGIGIHSGEAIVGNIGCAEKMDYSIIGDTVNLASRIESKTKEYQTPILISESTKSRIGDGYAVEFIDSVTVKGREQAVNLYRVMELDSNEVSDEQ